MNHTVEVQGALYSQRKEQFLPERGADIQDEGLEGQGCFHKFKATERTVLTPTHPTPTSRAPVCSEMRW